HKHVDTIKIIGIKSFTTFVAKAFSLGTEYFPWNAIYAYLRQILLPREQLTKTGITFPRKVSDEKTSPNFSIFPLW
ncbi:hypothetical protein, partial [Porphyromonas endodontalis]